MSENIILEMNQITKKFGANKVLDTVDFELKKGEIHALLGANGAGKSTLMKILNGIFVSYDGQIKLNGNTINLTDPHDASLKGIAMIHQELELVPNLDVCSNIYLGYENKGKNFINHKQMRKNAQELLDRLSINIQADELVSSLSTAKQQLVLIARSIALNPDVIIMDEPTSSLSISEIDNLFVLIKDLKARGISIIYISHYLEEVFRIADRATILRNGQKIITTEISKCTQQQIVEWMVGHKNVGEIQFLRDKPEDEVVFEAKNLMQSKGIVKDVSFQIRKGEVLGLAGAMGSGRTETAQIIFGIEKKAKGQIVVDGKAVNVNKNNPEKSAKLRVGYIPENRKSDGLLTSRSIMDNMGIIALDNMKKNGVIQHTKLRRNAQNLIDKLKIKCSSMYQDAISLSGGNQQKVVIGKWLSVEPIVLIMDQPTRGVDIGAKEEIYNLVNELAKKGMAILFISDELEEIMNLADRVLVIKHGSIVAELDNYDRRIQKSALLGKMVGE